MYKVIIRKLQAVVVALKGHAIRRQENRIHMAAEATDQAFELAEKRIELAEALRNSMTERACDGLKKHVGKANEIKDKASRELDELNSL